MGTMPPSGRKLSCMPLTAPQEVPVVDRGKEDQRVSAEADLLAFHVARAMFTAWG